MRRILAALALGAAVPATAAPAPAAPPAAATSSVQAMRDIWTKQKVPDVAVVQQVWTRGLGFKLARPFVPAFRNQTGSFYIMEFVPDGEAVTTWTRMVTATGTLGVGAAHLSDAELAGVMFDRGTCTGRVFRDLGGTASPVIAYRTIVIGCGAPGDPGSERAIIALFRDTENAWTVQYAERGVATASFEALAQEKLAAIAPYVTCKPGDAGTECAAK